MATIPTSARKRPRQQRSKETVEVLLKATAQVLLRDGYDKLSTNRIAKAAGVSVGSLYQYFPNKEALVMELAQRHNQRNMADLSEHIETLLTAPLHESIATYVRSTIHSHRQEPELDRVLTVQLLTLGMDLIEVNQVRARQLVTAYLEARKDTLLPTNLKMAAWMMVTIVESTVHGALLEDATLLDDPAFEQELIAVLLRYLTGNASHAQ